MEEFSKLAQECLTFPRNIKKVVPRDYWVLEPSGIYLNYNSSSALIQLCDFEKVA